MLYNIIFNIIETYFLTASLMDNEVFHLPFLYYFITNLNKSSKKEDSKAYKTNFNRYSYWKKLYDEIKSYK